MDTAMILLVLGLAGGFLSGMIGIGGGIVLVPALVYFIGFSQHEAQGTVLFMLMFPIGILGVYNYYQAGNIEIKTAAIMALTFFVGSYLGSKVAVSIDQATLKKLFGVILLLVSIKMMLGK